MYKINNRKTLSLVSKRAFKYSKVRNAAAIFAIILTATLFTSLFSIGASAIHSIQQSTMVQVGTSAHAGFKFLSWPQYEKVAQDSKVKDISYNIFIAIAENPELSKEYTEIRYTEEKAAEWSFCAPTTGRLPLSEDEAAVSVRALDALGVRHELGAQVRLDFTANGVKYSDIFTLCGFWENDEAAYANEAFVSREYAEKVAPTWQEIPEEAGVMSDYAGSVNPSLWFTTSFDIDAQVQALKERCGFGADVNEGVNWAYAASEVDATTVLLAAGTLLLIMISAYLVIYNIFYISVSKDIKFYGLLKTIGATDKQLGKIVRKQAAYLCAAGTPAGLIAGYILSFVIVPAIMDTTEIKDMGVSANPLIFIGGALFTFATVMISCIKPCSYAAKVSPIEAVRYSENPDRTVENIHKKRKMKRTDWLKSKSAKNKIQKTRKNAMLAMAWGNIRRNPKKSASVILSISLSMILFNAAVTLSSGFDMDKYIENSVVSDFYITDKSIASATYTEKDISAVSPELIDEVQQLDGVTETGCVYMKTTQHKLSEKAFENAVNICEKYSEELPEKYAGDLLENLRHDHTMMSNIYGIDGIAMDKMEIVDGKFDKEKFMSGKYIIVSAFTNTGNGRYYDIGDKVTVDFGNGRSGEYEVMAIGDVPYALGPQFSYLLDIYFTMYSNEYINMTDDSSALKIAFNTDKEKYDSVEAWVEDYCSSVNSDMDYKSRLMYEESFKSTQNMYMLVGAILSFVLALIGALNFVNTMITSISARSRELAVLQAVGMTQKQMNKMLIGEGACYSVASAVFTLTAGSVISYALVAAVSNQMWFFTYHFTITPVLAALPALFIVSLLVPYLCCINMRRSSTVDRLRAAE